jgi:hypothetical protein
MMQRWGRRHVSSALEVYLVLSSPPSNPRDRSDWKDLFWIEPPVWGGAGAQRGVLDLAARGYHVWTWDDHGVVLSDLNVLPPATVRYRPWNRAASYGVLPIQVPSPSRDGRGDRGPLHCPASRT